MTHPLTVTARSSKAPSMVNEHINAIRLTTEGLLVKFTFLACTVHQQILLELLAVALLNALHRDFRG